LSVQLRKQKFKIRRKKPPSGHPTSWYKHGENFLEEEYWPKK